MMNRRRAVYTRHARTGIEAITIGRPPDQGLLPPPGRPPPKNAGLDDTQAHTALTVCVPISLALQRGSKRPFVSPAYSSTVSKVTAR